MSFIISGMGRSGTAFVARELSRSKQWDVKHEPDASMDVEAIRSRFAGTICYGEVNSHLLFCMDDMPVARLAIILRDPVDVAVSMVRKNHVPTYAMSDNIAVAAAMIDKYYRRGVMCFDFKEVTTDPYALLELARHVGIHDLSLSDFDMSKANQSDGDLGWMDLDRDVRGMIERPVRWFRLKYGRQFGWDLEKL